MLSFALAPPSRATARTMMRFFIAAYLLLSTFPVSAVPIQVDLLVLAIDTSSSVSPEEYRLQVQGLAEAFRDPTVLAAIRGIGNLGIAVTLVQWAKGNEQVQALPWARVRNREQAERLSNQIAGVPRLIRGGTTGIGGAILFSVQLLETNDFQGTRRVIDISGDGRANHGTAPEVGRDAAVASGITVNGLAILNEIPLLDRYFRNQVIGGTGAFVVVAKDWRDFAVAILAKLIKEISAAPVA